MSRLFKKAVQTYNEKGFLTLLNDGFQFVKTHVIMGGLSSRPYVAYWSGLLRPIYNAAFKLRYGSGVDVMGEDWDTLVLLDACRYDDFQSQNWLSGRCEKRISAGADSREFIQENFVDRNLHDTVYVTANPHVHLLNNDTFHAVVDYPLSQWDSETKCVRPEKVTDAALQAHQKYPNKRIIVHYMQPHDPPLGPKGSELRNHVEFVGVDDPSDGMRLFEVLASGDVEVDCVREAYRETLDIALEEVDRLLKQIEGRIVISADHGEMFGEQPYPILGKLYEHYNHPHTLELCQVPWHVIDDGTRREITPEPPLENRDSEDQNIEEKLEALGYK